MPATTVSARIAPSTSRRKRPRLRTDEPHPLVHGLERWCRRFARLLGADPEQPLQLALVPAQPLVALLDRREQLDDRLADVFLEAPVALAVVVRLDIRDRGAADHGHDLDQVRNAG